MVSFSFFQFRLVTLGDEAHSSVLLILMRVWTKCLTLHIFSQRSLELSQFNVKSLLRRAAAYEALERYRLAYIDYKTALQIDCNIAAAHDGTNRYLSCRLPEWFLKYQKKWPRDSNNRYIQSFWWWKHAGSHFLTVFCCLSGWRRRSQRQTGCRGEKSFLRSPPSLFLSERNLLRKLPPLLHNRTRHRSRTAPNRQTNLVRRVMFLLHSLLELVLREVMSFSSLYVFR